MYLSSLLLYKLIISSFLWIYNKQCFVFKTLRTESACHKILIKSKQAICNETDEACGSTINIVQNKESIIKTITSCLIQPICQLDKKWLKYLEAEHSITLTPANLENLKLIVKKLAQKLENSKETEVLPDVPVWKLYFTNDLEKGYLNVWNEQGNVPHVLLLMIKK